MDVPVSKIIVPPAIAASNGVESRPAPPAVELAMASFCDDAFGHTDSKERSGVAEGDAVD